MTQQEKALFKTDHSFSRDAKVCYFEKADANGLNYKEWKFFEKTFNNGYQPVWSMSCDGDVYYVTGDFVKNAPVEGVNVPRNNGMSSGYEYLINKDL
jgi:hypothetical protein